MNQKMKTKFIRVAKLSAMICLGLGSASSFAMTDKTGEAKPFDCIDKQTFEMNAECMSTQIENNLVFKNAEKTVIKNASEASDRALATMTFDNRTMTIKIVAHRDAAIAKADTKKD